MPSFFIYGLPKTDFVDGLPETCIAHQTCDQLRAYNRSPKSQSMTETHKMCRLDISKSIHPLLFEWRQRWDRWGTLKLCQNTICQLDRETVCHHARRTVSSLSGATRAVASLRKATDRSPPPTEVLKEEAARRSRHSLILGALSQKIADKSYKFAPIVKTVPVL